MSAAAVVAPEAKRDLRSALRRISADNRMAAANFRNAVEAAVGLIGAKPELGRVRLNLAPQRYRFWSIAGFPYLLVYDVSQAPVRIARIIHTSRDLPKALVDLDF